MRLIDVDALGIGYANPDVFQQTEYARGWNAAVKLVMNAPTIGSVPVVHAKWKYKVAYTAFVHVTNLIYCTSCGKGFHRIEGVNFNFCPGCGAKMDGDPHDSC